MKRAILPALLLVCGLAAAGDGKPIWLVVTRPRLAPALEPLAAHRRAEGFTAIVTTEPVEKALAAAPRRPAYLLLVGDDEDGKAAEPWCVPARRLDLYRWRRSQRPRFASDAAWGDLDGDLSPDLPVGRLPVRSREEAAAAVAKILAFERRPPAESDLRLVVWGGAPGYGRFIDSMATGLLIGTVRNHAPAWLGRFMISASPGRALCGWPPDHPDVFNREMRRGSLISAMIAHADEEYVFSMRHEGKPVVYDVAHARAALAEGPPLSPLVVLACYAGRFTGPKPSLAEELLSLPGGPVAVVAATTESHPLTNYYTGVALLKSLGGDARRFGDVWHEAQTRAKTESNFLVSRALAGAEGSLEPEIDQAKLRRDQGLMYALLGDPATPLKRPDPLEVEVRRTEKGFSFKVERPEGAVRLSVALRPLSPPKPAGASGGAEEARKRFSAANAAGEFEPLETIGAGSPWEGEVEGPGWLRLVATGPGVLRVAAVELSGEGGR